jgi:hypothetical protein
LSITEQNKKGRAMSAALLEKLKELFKGHPDAEAVIAQAEAEEAAKAAPVAPAIAEEAAPVAEVPDVDAPHPRNVTLYARYVADRGRK